MLKYKLERVVSLQDWDNLVTKTYGIPYSLQQQDGCKSRGNEYFSVGPDKLPEKDCHSDSLPEEDCRDQMGVAFKTWLARDPKKPLKNQEWDWQLKLFYKRHFYPALNVVAQDLFKKGLIEAGDYIIVIDW